MFKAVIVGAGAMGRAWADAIKNNPDTEIAGWVDLNPDTISAASEQLQVSGFLATDDLGKALAEVRPDFVVDVTIPEAHHDVTIQALTAGVPVIGEKPMAVSMDQARAMVAASEKSGKLYMVSQNRRFNTWIQSYKRLIDTHLGQLGILNSDFYIGAHFGGFRDEMDHVLILDMAIHTLDQARYLSGADPVSVYCEEFNPHWSWYKGAASVTAIYEMTGGLRYTYRGSWCSEGLHTSWDADWRAVGSSGTAVWHGEGIPRAEVVTNSGGFFSDFEVIEGQVDESAPRSVHGSLIEFLDALKTGKTPMCECHDNIKSLAMVFAAIESAETGAKVPVRW